MRRLAAGLWEQWRTIHHDTTTGRDVDWRPLVILTTTALSLTLQHYAGSRAAYRQLYPQPVQLYAPGSFWLLGAYAWWAGWRVLGYLGLPVIVIACVPGERMRDYGISWRGSIRHWTIYAGMFVAVLPLVYAASLTRPFQQTYPFYSLANRSMLDLAAWELLYALQFVALEFFFRGFMLQGLKRSLGVYSIWIMMVPYVMIHFGKPPAETVAAMFAGLILGTLALRTGSIWGGAFLHIAVAWTMDLLALTHCRPGPVCH